MHEWTHVSSSNISAFRYDEDSCLLEIEFLNGSVYQYFDVPMSVFENFSHPPGDSFGRYFSRFIRGVFRYARL